MEQIVWTKKLKNLKSEILKLKQEKEKFEHMLEKRNEKHGKELQKFEEIIGKLKLQLEKNKNGNLFQMFDRH